MLLMRSGRCSVGGVVDADDVGLRRVVFSGWADSEGWYGHGHSVAWESRFAFIEATAPRPKQSETKAKSSRVCRLQLTNGLTAKAKRQTPL